MEDPKAELFLNEGIYANLGISTAGPSNFDIVFSYPLFLPAGEKSFGEGGCYLSCVALLNIKGAITGRIFKFTLGGTA